MEVNTAYELFKNQTGNVYQKWPIGLEAYTGTACREIKLQSVVLRQYREREEFTKLKDVLFNHEDPQSLSRCIYQSGTALRRQYLSSIDPPAFPMHLNGAEDPFGECADINRKQGRKAHGFIIKNDS
jgi:hypothetical protein